MMTKKNPYRSFTGELGDFVDLLTNDPEIMICGPSGSSPKSLRVYTHGGCLCKIPIQSDHSIVLPSRAYLKEQYVPEKSQVSLDQIAYDYDASEAEAGQLQFMEKYLPELKAMAKKRFSNKKGKDAERAAQTKIVRSHRDFAAHGHTAVVDIETAISKTKFQSKTPNFDMLALTLPEDCESTPTVWMIELKCNKNACFDEKRGIAAHADDMSKVNQKEELQSHVVNEILIPRLDALAHYEIVKNCPPDFAERLREQLPAFRSAFLLTAGEGLENHKKAVEICKQCLHEDTERFQYLFCDTAEGVDLSQFQSWEEFSK